MDLEEKKHILDIDSKKIDVQLEEQQWRCCSFDLHPQSSLFFGKLTVSILTIGLCTYQLINQEDCSFQSLYSSILSTVVVFWLNNKIR